LAPADYHRYHSPITGRVGPTKSIEGTYYVRRSSFFILSFTPRLTTTSFLAPLFRFCDPCTLPSFPLCSFTPTILPFLTDRQPLRRQRKPRRLHSKQARRDLPPRFLPLILVARPGRIRADRCDAGWSYCEDEGGGGGGEEGGGGAFPFSFVRAARASAWRSRSQSLRKLTPTICPSTARILQVRRLDRHCPFPALYRRVRRRLATKLGKQA
jgi:hypothetical protein